MSTLATDGVRNPTPLDRMLSGLGRAFASLAGAAPTSRPMPVRDDALDHDEPSEPSQRRLSGALMRVNHVGEICAQALYEAQAASTVDPVLEGEFRAAAREEGDHLAWTRERLRELGARPSLLNPMWYAGSFAIGLLAGRMGDRISLGFMAETERQVESHLARHLDRLPPTDTRSRAIVAAMQEDEARHGEHARRLGGVDLPPPARWAMRAASRVMTTTAHYI